MSFQCVVVTPEQQVVDAEVKQVIVPAHDGLLGILTNRSPVLVKLGLGALTIDTVQIESHVGIGSRDGRCLPEQIEMRRKQDRRIQCLGKHSCVEGHAEDVDAEIDCFHAFTAGVLVQAVPCGL